MKCIHLLFTFKLSINALSDYVNISSSRASVKIDARRLSTILNYNQINSESAVLCKWVWFTFHEFCFSFSHFIAAILPGVSENEALVIHLTLSQADMGSVTFYLPVILDGMAGIDVA